MNLLIRKLRDNADIPERATSGSAGYDISACLPEPVIIKSGEIKKIPTGIAVSLESNNSTILIFARSGLAMKHGVCLVNSVGVIDSDYRGEIFIPLINHSKEDYIVSPGQRIAQMVIMPINLPNIIAVDMLSETARGNSGFGSTGE